MSPEAAIEVVPQETNASDPQVPESNCIRAPEVLRFVPTEVRLIVGEDFVATNLNHTSSFGLPRQLPIGTLRLAVAAATVPSDTNTLVDVGRRIADEHSSLPGFTLTRILNVQPAELPKAPSVAE